MEATLRIEKRKQLQETALESVRQGVQGHGSTKDLNGGGFEPTTSQKWYHHREEKRTRRVPSLKTDQGKTQRREEATENYRENQQEEIESRRVIHL